MPPESVSGGSGENKIHIPLKDRRNFPITCSFRNEEKKNCRALRKVKKRNISISGTAENKARCTSTDYSLASILILKLVPRSRNSKVSTTKFRPSLHRETTGTPTLLTKCGLSHILTKIGGTKNNGDGASSWQDLPPQYLWQAYLYAHPT